MLVQPRSFVLSFVSLILVCYFRSFLEEGGRVGDEPSIGDHEY